MVHIFVYSLQEDVVQMELNVIGTIESLQYKIVNLLIKLKTYLGELDFQLLEKIWKELDHLPNKHGQFMLVITNCLVMIMV